MFFIIYKFYRTFVLPCYRIKWKNKTFKCFNMVKSSFIWVSDGKLCSIYFLNPSNSCEADRSKPTVIYCFLKPKVWSRLSSPSRLQMALLPQYGLNWKAISHHDDHKIDWQHLFFFYKFINYHFKSSIIYIGAKTKSFKSKTQKCGSHIVFAQFL